MNCAEAIAQLGAQLDGQVPPGITVDLDAHLAGCAGCRERFAHEAELEGAIARALRTAPDQAQDDARWAHALDATTPARPGGVTAPSWWARFSHPPSRSQLRWFALVASLALLATFSMAGLGLRRSLHVSAPHATDQQATAPGASR